MSGKINRHPRTFWQWLFGLPGTPVRTGMAAKLRKAARGDVFVPAERPPGEEGAIPLEESPERPAPKLSPAEQTPCRFCGGAFFAWGWLETGLYGIAPKDRGQGPIKYAKAKTRFGDFIGLKARMCEICGHVEVFANTEEE